MNLCIYVFISLKGKTHVVFLFQICFHLIDRLRNIFKKTQRHYIFVFFLTFTNTKHVAFIVVCDFWYTENQSKSCPRRYPKWPQKESLETSWEVPKTSKKSFLAKTQKSLKITKIKLKKKRFKSPPLRHVTFSKRTCSQKKRFFYVSFFQPAFEVIFKHQKTSKVRLSPAREPDFHCSTKSSKYAEQAFIFDPKSNVKTNKHKYGNFQKV